MTTHEIDLSDPAKSAQLLSREVSSLGLDIPSRGLRLLRRIAGE